MRLGKKKYSPFEILKSWLNGAAFRLYFLKIWFGEVASRLNLKGGPASVESFKSM